MAGGTFVDADLIQSKAFLSLTGIAPQVLLILLNKRVMAQIKQGKKKKRICVNCDKISMTYLEAEKRHGITKPRFSRAIDDLLRAGFIEIVHPGGGCQKDKAVYKISEIWRIWHKGQVLSERAKSPIKRGFQRGKKSFSTYENVPIQAYENVPIDDALG